MSRTPLAVLALPALAVLLVLIATSSVAGAADLREDPCFRDRELRTGGAPGLYTTVAPFEHFASRRSQVFPRTCSLAELTGAASPEVLVRRAAGDYATPYIAATRARDELFVYGYGPDAATQGGYVASVDPRTLQERWRTRILDPRPDGQWSYPGVLAVHGNGRLYAVYGNVLVKLDAASGAVLARRELPEDPEGTGAVYNGMVVLPDGRIVTKKIERGPCATAAPGGAPGLGETFGGLRCAVENALPSLLVVVDPGDLEVLATAVPPEPVTGRITAHRTDGRDHVYVAGSDHLRRFRYSGGRLRLDRDWGPVRYRDGDQEPGTGPGVMDGFLVVQTNFLPSPSPLTLTAVSLRDDRRVFRARPFAGVGGGSFIVSKAALDAANDTVVTHDFAARRMAALRLDPERGFELRWRRRLTSLNFSALVGGPRDREIVIADLHGASEEVVWLDERTGEERARTGTLANGPAPGNIVTPGFRGRFYHVTAAGALYELRPDPSGRDARRPRVRVEAVRAGRIVLELSEPAAVRAVLRRGGRVVARAQARLASGRGRLRLGRATRGGGRLRVHARDAAGNPAVVRAVVPARGRRRAPP